MKSLIAFLAVVFALTTFSTHAQPRAPQLMAGEKENERKPLGLASAEIHLLIAGPIAQTTMTLTFRNDTARVLEGELSFPLPEGATVSGFGLDVNGTMVDGVPVPRQKARITFEKESRKRVDPGLVEQAVGNNFRTRVYPIPANGRRTIKVQYISEVAQALKGGSYRMPLGWGEVIDEVAIKVEVTNPASADAGVFHPVVMRWGTSVKADADAMTPVKNSFVAEKAMKGVKLDADLVVGLPEPAKTNVLVERRVKGAQLEDLLAGKAPDAGRSEFFFAINDTQLAPKDIGRIEKQAVRVSILWDASLSRLEADKTRELALLKRVLANVNPNGTVDLVPFRNVPDAPQSFDLRDGKSDELFKAIGNLIYDGGTNLSLLPIVKNYADLPGAGNIKKATADYDYWLLFTDGLADLGAEMPRKLDARTYVISNDAKSNHTLLRRIAAQSGGQYFNLQRLSDDQVAGAIGHEPFMLLGIDSKQGEVADIYPRGAQAINGPIMISGKLLVPEAKISLKYGSGGVVTQRVELTLKQEGATKTGLIPRLWAQQKVADLSSDVDANADELAAVGKEFNLVTPNSSLLVLETVEQYLEYQIVPPESFKAVHEAFMARIEQQKAAVAQSREERIQHVLALWQQRVQWWEKKYEYPKDLVVRASENKGDLPLAASLMRDPRARREAALRSGPATQPGAPNLNISGGTIVTEGRPDFDNAPDLSLQANRLRRGDSAGRARGGGGGGGGLFGGQGGGDPARDHPTGLSGKISKDGMDLADSVELETITIKQWDPNVPYLVAMREAGGDGAYPVYLKQRKAFIASPAFYLDCADYLLRNGQRSLGLRVLTNIAELKLENAQLLRIVAHRLNQIGERELAIDLFEKIKKLRPEEPQSWRDLALALSDRADAVLDGTRKEDPAAAAMAYGDYEQALKLLDHVVMTQWDRFEEIEVTALMEANRIIARLQTNPSLGDINRVLDSRLIKNLDCDARIVLTWDADLTDVDLWVTEPSGEKCLYSHNRTTIGGLLSRDFTQGYGPEEYCLRRSMPGEYKIQANYYGSSQTSLVGPATVQAVVISNFGRSNEKRQTMTLRLTNQRDVVDIGAVTFK